MVETLRPSSWCSKKVVLKIAYERAGQEQYGDGRNGDHGSGVALRLLGEFGRVSGDLRVRAGFDLGGRAGWISFTSSAY